jgi:glycosyltransferase involved in cell wall biosynthesis
MKAITDGANVKHSAAASTSSPEAASKAALRRVVLVLPTYLPESFGGAEQQSRKLAFALGRRGVAVTLLAPRLLPTTAKHETSSSVSLRRFRLRKPPNLGGRHLGSLLLWSLKLSWWLAINRRQYDIVHVIHGRLHAVPAVVAASLLGKPTLVKIGRGGVDHFDLDIVHNKRVLGPWYARTIVRHASAYIANSREIVDDLIRWNIPRSKIYEIPNGVELPPANSVRSTTASIRFVFVGRLDREKAVDLMIRGFARLPRETSYTLTIVGDGECRRDLHRLVDELREDRIRFTGALDDVASIFCDADVFVSTSLSEGMSNALLEAMSFGVMPLVSRVSGVSDIVGHGQSGLLFAPGNLEAFQERLSETVALTPDSRRTFGDAARVAVAERFGIDEIADRHITLYAQLLRGIERSNGSRPLV